MGHHLGDDSSLAVDINPEYLFLQLGDLVEHPDPALLGIHQKCDILEFFIFYF